MIKRTDNGCWAYRVGAMELGEDLKDTAKRETKEEVGIEVSDIELFGCILARALLPISKWR